jgi:hypothetical protein
MPVIVPVIVVVDAARPFVAPGLAVRPALRGARSEDFAADSRLTVTAAAALPEEAEEAEEAEDPEAPADPLGLLRLPGLGTARAPRSGSFANNSVCAEFRRAGRFALPAVLAVLAELPRAAGFFVVRERLVGDIQCPSSLSRHPAGI